jgi:hypothetical protein
MNILQRIGAALVGQIERENKATSLNTAEPIESDEQKGRRIASYYGVELPVMTVKAEPDWKAIADELYWAAKYDPDHDIHKDACWITEPELVLACVCGAEQRFNRWGAALARYEAAKQVKP